MGAFFAAALARGFAGARALAPFPFAPFGASLAADASSLTLAASPASWLMAACMRRASASRSRSSGLIWANSSSSSAVISAFASLTIDRSFAVDTSRRFASFTAACAFVLCFRVSTAVSIASLIAFASSLCV